MATQGRNDKCACGSGKKFKQCCSQKNANVTATVPILDISKTLQSAVSLHQSGRLAEAQLLYQQILQRNPRQSDALHFLGVLAFQSGDHNQAINFINQAIKVDPAKPLYFYNQGLVFRSQGDFIAAANSYRRAIALKPDYSEAYYNLGNALFELANSRPNTNFLLEAEVNYRYSLTIKPNPDTYNNLGKTLEKLGRLDEALECYNFSLNSLTDWNAEVRNLASPLFLHTHLILKSESASHNPLENREISPPELEDNNKFLPYHSFNTETHHAINQVNTVTSGTKNLRIALIYPPPWQIHSPDESHLGMPFGPPTEKISHELNGDFQTIPYGLLTLAAQAKAAGYDVHIYNLSTSSWQDVVTLISQTDADVFGLSAFTSNRRGMGAVAALIRQQQPQSHIIAGGPFVTALPKETLNYYREIDTVVIGEGEATLMELLACLRAGLPTAGIAGTAWRNGDDVILGPTRPRIDDLDALPSPFDHFTSDIVMTSRGCPSKCTFCGSATTWGNKLRFHSADSCIKTFKKALSRLPLPILKIKDDTFTADRRRAMAICDTIIENKINFLWSCDTRVDCLDDELLRKMRLAGCQVISLGVESGSPDILKSIHKETTPEMVLKATKYARKYGMYIRYYMMLLNRGETMETIKKSNDLIKTGRPNKYFFSPLSFHPGTEEWEILAREQGLTPEIFFLNDFFELSLASKRNKKVQELFTYVRCDIGTIDGFKYTVEEREAIVDLLPDLHSVRIDMANSYLLAGQLKNAENELNRAEDLGFPIGSIIVNQRACISLAYGDIDNAIELLENGLRSSYCPIIEKNFLKLKAWTDLPVNVRGEIPVLDSSVNAIDFQFLKLENTCRI